MIDEANAWMLGEQRRSARAIAGVGIAAIAGAVALVVLAQLLDAPLYDRLILRLRLMGVIVGVIGFALAISGAVMLARVRRLRRELEPGLPVAVARVTRER